MQIKEARKLFFPPQANYFLLIRSGAPGSRIEMENANFLITRYFETLCKAFDVFAGSYVLNIWIVIECFVLRNCGTTTALLLIRYNLDLGAIT